MKQPDALKGLKHHEDEKLIHDVTLKPFEHLVTPNAPRTLDVRVFNMDPDHTYIVRIFEVVDSVQLKRKK